MTQWIDFKKNPPTEDTCAVVANTKGWMSDVMAIYYISSDTWITADPNLKEMFTLEVTHNLPLPKTFPGEEHD